MTAHLLAPVADGRADWGNAAPVRTGPLTATQARVHAAVREYTAAHGYPPMVREVAAALGMSKSGAWYQLGKLTGAGLLGTEET